MAPAVIMSITPVRRGGKARRVLLDPTEEFILPVDLVKHLALREGDEVDREELLREIGIHAPEAARQRALRLIKHRDRSRAELIRKLEEDGYEPAIATACAADLERVGLVDDERFAEGLARKELVLKSHGRRRALAELAEKGVAEALAERVVDLYAPRETERDRATEVACRLARQVGDAERLTARLVRRGYTWQDARAAAEEALDRG